MTCATDAAWTDTLKGYYQKSFPSNDFCNWLSYGSMPKGTGTGKSTDFLFRREFSFTLPGDIYCRYLSFKSADEFRKALESSLPDKIDIGAVFTISPKHYKEYNIIGPAGGSSGNAFRPVERELVFDIDMDEYDDVRTCCKGAQVCQKCWTFIAAAVRCINETLREDFGFKHIMFVYSGRRGVHCWVCDETARLLSNEQRSAVAEYMQMIAGPKGSSGLRCTNILKRRGMLQFPVVSRSVSICAEYFEKPGIGILDGQNVFKCSKDTTEQSLSDTNPNLFRVIQGLADDSAIKQDIPSFIRLAARDQRAAWKRISDDISVSAKKKKIQTNIGTEDILIEFTYPRLDINVSKQMNHLLKAPFCVHPKTGRICVPILDLDKPELFQPDKAPLVSDVVNGTDSSMKKYLEYFENFVADIIKDNEYVMVAEVENPMDF